jgi:hypothetical protein
MRTYPFRVIVLAVAVAAMAVPCALCESNFLRADIPFQFMVGEKVMPAGAYRMDFDPIVRRVIIRRLEGGPAIHALARSAVRPATQECGVLVFHKYENTYVLWQAQQAGRSESYELPQARAEREMANRVPVQLAMLRAH